MLRVLSVVIVTVVTQACGGGSVPAESPRADPPANPPTAVASAAPSSPSEVGSPPPEDTAAESTPRAKDAAKWLRGMADIDLPQQGILATNGLSEEQFGLPAPLRTGMEAATNKSFDPSQSDRILVAALEEAAPDTVQSLCGKPLNALVKEMMAVPNERRAAQVVERCKLAEWVDVTKVPRDSFVFPLLSAVVQRTFQSEGGHSKAELELAKLIAVARRNPD